MSYSFAETDIGAKTYGAHYKTVTVKNTFKPQSSVTYSSNIPHRTLLKGEEIEYWPGNMNRAEFFANQRLSWPVDSKKETSFHVNAQKADDSKTYDWSKGPQKEKYLESSTQKFKYWQKSTVNNVEPQSGFQSTTSYYKSEYVVGAAPESKVPNTKKETAAENVFDATLNRNPGPVTFPPTNRVTNQKKQIVATIPRTRTRFRYRNYKIIASSSRPKFGEFKLTASTNPTVSKIKNMFQIIKNISDPFNNTKTVNKSNSAFNDFEDDFSEENVVLNLDSKKLLNISKPDSIFELLETVTLEPIDVTTMVTTIIVPNTESYMEEIVDFMLNDAINNETDIKSNINLTEIVIINQDSNINSSYVNVDDIFKAMTEALQSKDIAKLKELAARLNISSDQINPNNISNNSIKNTTVKHLNRGRSYSKKVHRDKDSKPYVAPRVRNSRLNRGRKLTHSP